MMDRTAAKKVIALTYFLGCLCLLTQGVMDFGSVTLAVLIFLSGMCINGAQNGLQAYSPAYYQTEIRATGVSWMHGIGRTGAILSSTLGGVIMLAVLVTRLFSRYSLCRHVWRASLFCCTV